VKALFVFVALLSLLLPALADTNERQLPIRASLSDLLVNADRYAGRRIAVYGYLDRNVGLDLFLTKDHAEGRDFVSAISVADTDNMDVYESGCLDSYVVLTGTFIRSDTDYVLTAITRVYHSAGTTVCWQSGG
jgi:hypothetical protein